MMEFDMAPDKFNARKDDGEQYADKTWHRERVPSVFERRSKDSKCGQIHPSFSPKRAFDSNTASSKRLKPKSS
jgi:hypothetical protein